MSEMPQKNPVIPLWVTNDGIEFEIDELISVRSITHTAALPSTAGGGEGRKNIISSTLLFGNIIIIGISVTMTMGMTTYMQRQWMWLYLIASMIMWIIDLCK